jgi:EAL domain-containing protein (putative c-di-GMP-specific phosphodiesterase class I)
MPLTEDTMEPVERNVIEHRIRKAVEAGEFRLYYQPQHDATTNRILGAEALLRWHDPAAGVLEPGHFMHALETTGLIAPVGEWAFKQAAEDCQRWQRLGLPRLKLGVNVSPSQLTPQGAQILAQRVKEMRSCCDLQIEISGVHLVAAADGVIAALHSLRFAGADISVQHFGLDDYTHKRVWSLPVDALKIDRSFICRMTEDPEVDEELAGMLMLARAYRLVSVAEGVETRQQCDRLRELNCDLTQGYLHAPPMPAERFEWLLGAECYGRPGIEPRTGRLAYDA